MKRNKGFTLIELLVVIAIIGILSAIVLASLSTARTKANDAKVRNQIASLRSAAELYYATWSSYGNSIDCVAGGMGLDTVTGFKALVTGTNYPSSVAPTCTTDSATAATKWSAYHVLSTAGVYSCSDSTGKSEVVGVGQTITINPSGAACP